MLTIIVVTGSCIALLASALLYRLAAGSLHPARINMMSFPFYLLTGLSFVISIIITLRIPFLTFDPNEFGDLFSDPIIRLRVWGMLLWMFLGIPLGALFVSRSCGIHSMRRVLQRHTKSTVGTQQTASSSMYFIAFLFSTTLLFSLTFYRLYSGDQLPIINLIQTGDIVGTQAVRRQFQLGSEGFAIFDSIFNPGQIFPWMCYTVYALAKSTHLLRWRILFAALLAITIGFLVLNTAISPILFFLAGFVVVRAMLGIKTLHLHEIACFAALMVGLSIVFKGSETDLFLTFKKITLGRLMVGQNMGLYYLLELFPAKEHFIGLASTGREIHSFFHLPYSPSYGLISMAHYNPEGVAAGTAGHFTTIFMGEAWANFGLWGVLIAPLWVGAFVQSINLAFLLHQKSAASIGLYVSLTGIFGYSSDFQSFYYPAGLTLFLIGVASILFFINLVAVRRTRPISSNANPILDS